MREFVKGMLARSKAGHDTGKLYVVMYADTEYVYLTDGIHRTLDKMKKKKRKHIQIIYNLEYASCYQECFENRRDFHFSQT